MTLLAVVKDVCATVGVQVPTSVFGGIANNRTMQEMLALANEMAQRIAYDTRDWTTLQTQAFFTGDGTAGSFLLPADFKRMLLTANVRRSTDTVAPMLFIPDLDEWIDRRVNNTTEGRGEWIISGGYIWFWPVLGVGVTARFPYLQRNCVALTSGGYGDSFMTDTDSFRLDERLLKLGMTWQWKANKGSPYAEDMGSFSDALANAMGRDKPMPIIVGRRAMSWGNTSYPFPSDQTWTWPL